MRGSSEGFPREGKGKTDRPPAGARLLGTSGNAAPLRRVLDLHVPARALAHGCSARAVVYSGNLDRGAMRPLSFLRLSYLF
jgi:hypothetical protein